MNKEFILRVADAIEAETLPDGEAFEFDMKHWQKQKTYGPNVSGMVICRTAACIAGTAAMMLGIHRPEPNSGSDPEFGHLVEDMARDAMGLSVKFADNLFLGSSGWSVELITAPQAVRCLRNLAETGVVDWARSAEEVAA